MVVCKSLACCLTSSPQHHGDHIPVVTKYTTFKPAQEYMISFPTTPPVKETGCDKIAKGRVWRMVGRGSLEQGRGWGAERVGGGRERRRGREGAKGSLGRTRMGLGGSHKCETVGKLMTQGSQKPDRVARMQKILCKLHCTWSVIASAVLVFLQNRLENPIYFLLASIYIPN